MTKRMLAIHKDGHIEEPEKNIQAMIVTGQNTTLLRVVDESLRVLKGVGLPNSKGE